MSEAPRTVPPVLYVPLRTREDNSEAAAEIRQLRDGRRALLAYTALDRLFDRTGENQQWMLIRTDELDTLKADQPFDVVVFDLEVPEQFRRDGAIA